MDDGRCIGIVYGLSSIVSAFASDAGSLYRDQRGGTTMTIAGIILLAVAAGCFFVARGQAGRLQEMAATDTYTAQMLGQLYQQVTGAVGADSLAQQCEVAGVIECDAPLTAPVSGTACVAFARSV